MQQLYCTEWNRWVTLPLVQRVEEVSHSESLNNTMRGPNNDFSYRTWWWYNRILIRSAHPKRGLCFEAPGEVLCNGGTYVGRR